MSKDVPEEPLFALSAEDLAALDSDIRDQIKFICTQYVSEEIRKECEFEMAEAKKNRWKIKQLP